ncbi:MAG: serine hydrolase domain-containing protein [Burkholderiaceae bacterium]
MLAGLAWGPHALADRPSGGSAAHGAEAPGFAGLTALMESTTASGGYPGAVALVARDGRVVAFDAYGFADIARRRPLRRDAIFRIYSMTKPIATVAALMLVEEGRLSLDAPIETVLPEFAHPQVFESGTADAPVLRPAQRAITLRDLLTHTAGFATGGKGIEEPTRLLERANLHGSADLADFAHRASRLPLASDPGARFRYDGTNIEVASRMVEVASGMSFAAFLRKRLFEPLHMRDTGFVVPPRQRGRVVDLPTRDAEATLVRVHEPSALRPGVSLQHYTSGAGGLYSTASDYLHFCTMLLDGGRYDDTVLLSRETIAAMMKDQLPTGVSPGALLNPGESFGFGGYVVVDPATRPRPGSTGAWGWSGAASTYFTIDPGKHLIAILLMQYLPRNDAEDLPKVSARFYETVYRALEP